ncbi:hypothetical protein [Xanthomarina spongicola]|nr:hypothetical protein [Xanthomarina spongicola]PWK18923.1 hypothetical protein LX78_01397 [Xanthomarina spongicola]
MSWSGLEKTPEFNTFALTQTSIVPSGLYSPPHIEKQFVTDVIKWWTNNNNVTDGLTLGNCN